MRVVIAAMLLTAAALVYVVAYFAIDTDSARLIDDNVPWRQREKAFDAAFPHRTDLIAIVVDGGTPEIAEQATARLAQRLLSDASRYRAVWRPDGGPFFDRVGLLFESTESVAVTMQRLVAAQPLLGTLAADPSVRGLTDALSLMVDGAQQQRGSLDAIVKPLEAFATVLGAIAAGEKPSFSWQSLFTGQAPEPRALRRFILVQPVLDYTALQPGAQATTAIRTAVNALGLNAEAGLRVRLTGPVPLSDEEFSTLADGAALNASLLVGAMIALLWIAVRSWRLVGAIVACIAAGLVVTAAVGLVVYGAYNLISVAFAILFVGLGVDFGIQYCVCYRARRHAGDDLHRALAAAGREVGVSLALAAAAIAAGFFAFLPTDYRGVSELGVIAGIGMIIAFVATVTLLPALIAIFRPAQGSAAAGIPALTGVDRFLLRRRKPVLLVAVLVAVGASVLVPRLQFDFNPLHLRSPEAESVATLLDLMKDSSTAPDTIDVLAPSIEAATKLAQTLEKLPEVDHVLTLTTFVPEEQDKKLASIEDAALLLDPTLEPAAKAKPPTDAELVEALAKLARRLDEARTAIPDRAFAAVAEKLSHALTSLANGPVALRERAHAVLVPGLDVTLGMLRAALQASPVTFDALPAEVRRDWVAADGRARIEVYPKGDVSENAALRRFVAAIQAVAPDATGAPAAIEASSRTIIRAFTQAGLLALLSITVLLALALRRATDVGRALLPVGFAVLGTLGTAAATGLALNFENIIALPLMLGIGVAFDIYFVIAWRAGRGQPLQSSLARAVIMSALTTGTAFGSLWLSHHPGTSSMGGLLALSLAWTLISVLLFMPALLGDPPVRAAVETKPAR